jgi:hypothetical protein
MGNKRWKQRKASLDSGALDEPDQEYRLPPLTILR